MSTTPLAATQIETLTEAGGNRWTKNGHDRIYFNVDTIPGVTVTAKGYLTIDDETFSNRCQMAIKSCRFWVDVSTGEIHAETSDDRKVATEVADLANRFQGLVAGLLAVEEITTTPAEAEAAAVKTDVVTARIADTVPAARRARIAKKYRTLYGATITGDTLTFTTEQWDRVPAGDSWGNPAHRGNLTVVG